MFSNPARTPKALPRTGDVSHGVLSVGGLNVRDAYEDMPANDAISLRNLVSTAFGLRTRDGYQEWASNLPGNLPVPTIMSYYPAVGGASGIQGQQFGSIQGQAANQLPPILDTSTIVLGGQLFACTNLNIYDITVSGEGPWTAEIGVGNVTTDYWTWRNFQNAGGSFLIACNHDGAYVIFGGGAFSTGFSTGFSIFTSGFSRPAFGSLPGEISGISPDSFAYLTVWKKRIWFCEKNSTRSWYLPVDQITGEARQFDFGPQFRHGGFLVSLTNWSIDGGIGIDDYLVAVSSEGDVVIYKGYDPDAAGTDPNAFQLHGVWYVGPLPDGRRQVDPYGGDVYIFSSMGIKQVSKLVQTENTEDQNIFNISAKIDPLLTQINSINPLSLDYYLKILPNEDAMIVGVPETIPGEGVLQFYYTFPKRAWTSFYDLPVAGWVSHDHLTFAGTNRLGAGLGGAVYIVFQNSLDDVKTTPADPAVNGIFITCRMVPAYSHFDSPGLWKTWEMIRFTLLVSQTPFIAVNALSDFELPNFVPLFQSSPTKFALWNSGVWGTGIWGGSFFTERSWKGLTGGGYAGTVQLDFYAPGGSRVANYDWWTIKGGPL